MSWQGIGFVSRSMTPLSDANLIYPSPRHLSPGDGWDGTEASGFEEPPFDPVRVTGKPGLHMLTPDRQHFTDTLDIGAIAMANDGGSLYNNLGIAEVRFHFEGRTLSVVQPSWHTIITERGPRTYFGWWARLVKPADTSGYAHLYTEAVPHDATLQRRVSGPHLFAPRDRIFDGRLSVRPSLPEIPGSRYASIGAAMAHAKNALWQNYRVSLDEAGIYDIPDEGPNANDQKGWCEIVAGTAGAVIGKSGYTSDAAAIVQANKSPLRFRGSNLVLDLRHVTHFDANIGGNWLDGVTITTSDPLGRNGRLRGKHHASVGIGERFDASYFTECLIEDVLKVCQDAKLSRGCTLNRIAFDVFAENDCAVFNTVTDHSGAIWTADNPGLVIRYDGPESTATVAKAGLTAFNMNEAAFTFTWGLNSVTFETGQSEDHFNRLVGDGYSVQDLADFINAEGDYALTGLAAQDAGWSAVVEDPAFADMVCAQLGLPLDQGKSFTAADTKDADLALKVTINAHSDFYQQNRDVRENRIIAFNKAVDMETQNFLVSPADQGDGSGVLDNFFVGNAIYKDPEPATYYDPADNSSQFGRGTGCILSHVVFAHNSMNEKLRIRNDNNNNVADAYCLFANNVLEEFIWAGGNTLPSITIKNLRLFDGAIAPAGSRDVTVGGDMASLFVDAPNGDFRPTGLLTEEGFTPVIPVDLERNAFRSAAENGDAVGAISVTSLGDEFAAGLPLFVPPPPDDDPIATLLALINASAVGDSEFYDLAQATDTDPALNFGTFECIGQSENRNVLRQDGNRNDRPTITVGGAEFDAGKGEHLIQSIAGGDITVVMSLTKAAGDASGTLLANEAAAAYATYDAGNVSGFAQGVVVDGAPVATRGALYDALDTGGAHVVTVQGADFSGMSALVIGRTSGSLHGTVRRVAIIAHADFPDNLAQAIDIAQQAVAAP